MISAEHFALENQAIQQMISIREQGLNHMNVRVNAMATQAALIGGFIVTAFTSVNVLGGQTTLTHDVKVGFTIVTAVGLGSAVHVILAATLISVWGPGLALQGPRGSVSRAYNVMAVERYQIYASFMIMFVMFMMQIVICIWTKDEQKGWTTESSVGTAVMGLYFIFIVFSCFWMFQRIYPEFVARKFWWLGAAHYHAEVSEGQFLPDGTNKEAGDKGVQLLYAINQHPDYVDEESEPGNRAAPATTTIKLSPMHMRGVLNKRGAGPGNPLLGSADGNWGQRYFVLEGTTLRYWRSQADFEQGKTPCKADSPIHLKGYDVLVNPEDFSWGISLTPMAANDNRRSWYFRCANEHERVQWSQALLAGTLAAAGE